MGNEQYQKELFEFEQPKKRPFGFRRLIPRSGLPVTLSADRVILIAIGAVMLMVALYALGVERGRSMTETAGTPKALPARTAKKAPPPLPAQPPPKTQAVPQIKDERAAGPYTIVAVTFTRADTAYAEVNRLNKEGFGAFLAESEPYSLVCVGAYPDKESAESRAALNRMRRIYKDAYFKLR